jgi:predicted CxxxxCH...CXXCH cytochrome family protein
VGAHTSHVEAGPVAGAFDCGECHFPKPTSIDSPGHRDGTVQVVFGALAGTGTASPVWNGAPSPTCSSVYCHGATLGGGAGTILTPAWTTVDGSQASCGKCHRLPPQGHAPLAAGSTNQTCAVCHDQTVRAADGLIDVPQGKHVNGQLDVLADAQHPLGWMVRASPDFHAYQVNSRGPSSCQTCHAFQPPAQVTTIVCSTCHNGVVAPSLATCAGCHGGTDNLTGAPPRTTWGNGADAVRVGAHTSHVEGTHALATPVACNECHVVPADAFAAGHIDQATATLTWGTLATTGGANPLWTRTPPATCSATYCHGSTLPADSGTPNRTPEWTTTDGSQITCGTACHGSPPLTGATTGIPGGVPAHVWHVTDPAGPTRGCDTCHSGYTANSVVLATHVNGSIQVNPAAAAGWTCSACH